MRKQRTNPERDGKSVCESYENGTAGLLLPLKDDERDAVQARRSEAITDDILYQ
jgi:hypothetical protein